MSGRFEGRAVLVTGASRGIGREIARRFATEGARVAVHYGSNRVEAERTLAALEGEGHLVLQAEMADPDAVRTLVDEAAARFGRLDVLVNNAAIYRKAAADEADFDSWVRNWRETLAVNLEGPAHACFAAARHMIAAGGGRIVNISSRGAFRGEPEATSYAASKGGLNSLTQSLAKRLGVHGVRLYAVAPGWVQTDMAAGDLDGAQGAAKRAESPLGRVAVPADVAATVLFLASDEAEFLTGGIVDVNGASYLRM